jgi:molybdenum cofactor cytidylyltransferase
MGSSIATGVSALGATVAGVFIVPADMPLLTAGLLRSLIAAFDRDGAAPIVYPATPDGEQRNPILWPRRFFPKLCALSGAEGAKALLRTLLVESVAVTGDPAAFADVDTPADLQRASERLGVVPPT